MNSVFLKTSIGTASLFSEPVSVFIFVLNVLGCQPGLKSLRNELSRNCFKRITEESDENF